MQISPGVILCCMDWYWSSSLQNGILLESNWVLLCSTGMVLYGGVFVMVVFLFWCFCDGVFLVVFFVVVFLWWWWWCLWWCFGVSVVVFLIFFCGGGVLVGLCGAILMVSAVVLFCFFWWCAAVCGGVCGVIVFFLTLLKLLAQFPAAILVKCVFLLFLYCSNPWVSKNCIPIKFYI